MFTKVPKPPQNHASGGLWCCYCDKLIADDQPYVEIQEQGEYYLHACSDACADRIIRGNAPKLCLTPHCGRPTKGGSRGLCNNHYTQAYTAVSAGKTTWEAMEQAGLALPPRSSTLKLPE